MTNEDYEILEKMKSDIIQHQKVMQEIFDKMNQANDRILESMKKMLYECSEIKAILA